MPANLKPVNLFWSGGWDSSFRLMQLVVVYKKVVQPFYIADPNRKSIQFELNAIDKIRSLLIEKFPNTEKRILPIRIELLSNIKPNPELFQAYQNIIQKDKIGIQYEWQSRFCHENGIADMEICNETSIHSDDNIVKRVFGKIVKVEDETGYYFVVDEKFESTDAYILFRNFKLAVFEYTKLEMRGISEAEGFLEMMNQTWFCHLPKNNKPCGKCHPCRTVYREGLKWRLPFSAKCRYHTWPTLRKIAKILHLKYE